MAIGNRDILSSLGRGVAPVSCLRCLRNQGSRLSACIPGLRQVEFDCSCGNHITATVFEGPPYLLYCSKCDAKHEEEREPA